MFVKKDNVITEKQQLEIEETGCEIQRNESNPVLDEIVADEVVADEIVANEVEADEIVVDEIGAVAQAPMNTKTKNWNKQETLAKVVATKDWIQVKKPTNQLEEGKLKALSGHYCDSREQPAFFDQHSHEVTSKILTIVGFCKKFEKVCSRGFMFENKLIMVHEPYGFRLLVMGKRSYGILEQVLVETENLSLMDLTSLHCQLLILGKKGYVKERLLKKLCSFVGMNQV